MPFCPKCGKEVSPDALFCPYCGAPLTPVEKKKSRRKLLGALIGVGAFSVLGFLAYRYYGSEIKAVVDELLGKTTTITKTTTAKATGTTAPETTTGTTITSATSTTTTTPSTKLPATSTLTTATSSYTATSTSETATTTATTSSTTTAPPTVTAIPELPERDWSRSLTPYIRVGGQAWYTEAETCVINEGDIASYYVFAELYGGPSPWRRELKFIDHPLNSFELMWRKIITLNPGQRVDFKFELDESAPKVLVWVAYDPIFDPKGFRMNSDEKLRAVFRNSKDRNRHIIAMGTGGEIGEW